MHAKVSMPTASASDVHPARDSGYHAVAVPENSVAVNMTSHPVYHQQPVQQPQVQPASRVATHTRNVSTASVYDQVRQ